MSGFKKCIGCKKIIPIYADFQCFNCFTSGMTEEEMIEHTVKKKKPYTFETDGEAPTLEEINDIINRGADTAETWAWKRKLLAQ